MHRSPTGTLVPLDLEIEATLRRNRAERRRKLLQDRTVASILEEEIHFSDSSSPDSPSSRESTNQLSETATMVVPFVVKLMRQANASSLKKTLKKFISWGISRGKGILKEDFQASSKVLIISKDSGGHTLATSSIKTRVMMSNHKSTESALKNLEVQVGQLAKQIADKSSNSFGANTKNNPKEECKAVMTRSKRLVRAEDEESVVYKEKMDEKKGVKVKENDVKGKENQEKGKKIMMASRKRKSIGSRPTTQYDARRFHSFEAWTDTLIIHILAGRKVEIYHTKLDEFKAELERHNFHKHLNNLADSSIDLALVKEFYDNLYSPEGLSPKQVTIRGHLIRIDADNLNAILETLVVLDEGESLPDYSRYCRMPTDIREIKVSLCIPGRGFILNAEGHLGKILRKDLITLAQVWSVLSYSNLALTSHTLDLTVDRARLIFGLVTQLDMNITSMAQSNSSRLRFPALMTTLCRSRGVAFDSLVFKRLSRGARRPRARPAETPSTSAAPPPARLITAPSTLPPADFQRFEAMLQSIHQGQIILLQSLQLVAPPDSIPMVEQFNEWVAWPGTQPPLHREDEDPVAQVPHQPEDESSKSSNHEPLIRKRRVAVTQEAAATSKKSLEATPAPPTAVADTTSPQQAADPSTPEDQSTPVQSPNASPVATHVLHLSEKEEEHDGSWVKKGARHVGEEGHDGEDSSLLSKIMDRLIRQIGKSVVFTFSLSQSAGLASIR
ncbi:hypothetical protein HKD37_20G055976 [Glycine soja]